MCHRLQAHSQTCKWIRENCTNELTFVKSVRCSRIEHVKGWNHEVDRQRYKPFRHDFLYWSDWNQLRSRAKIIGFDFTEKPVAVRGGTGGQHGALKFPAMRFLVSYVKCWCILTALHRLSISVVAPAMKLIKKWLILILMFSWPWSLFFHKSMYFRI